MIDPLSHLGVYALERGDLSQAEAHYHDVFRLHAIGRRVQEALNAIEGLADVVQRQGRYEVAVRLMGSAASARASTDFGLSAEEQAELDATLTVARDNLDAANFTLGWNEGAAMSLEQAIAYARLVTQPDESDAAKP
ncbi:MAG: hypothetical protein M3439_13650 [Chloroflexota bacterium]|nr:hypothetical protein [Chloroflexota bacterium]